MIMGRGMEFSYPLRSDDDDPASGPNPIHKKIMIIDFR